MLCLFQIRHELIIRRSTRGEPPSCPATPLTTTVPTLRETSPTCHAIVASQTSGHAVVHVETQAAYAKK